VPARIHALGVDVGTTNTKAVVVEIGDTVREVRVVRRPTPGEGDAVRQKVRAHLREAAEGLPDAAIGNATMGESGSLLDVDGRAIGPLLRWDAAAPGEEADLALRARTGVPRAAKSTRALLRAATGVAATRRWAGGAELAALALTGRAITDATLALRTMLAELPPLGVPVRWDEDLVAATGLGVGSLPEILPPGARVPVEPWTAHDLGLPAGVPVGIAGHDHLVAAWAAGAREPGDVADSIGTAEGVIRIAAGRIDRFAAVGDGMTVGRTVDGAREIVLGGIPSASRLVMERAGRLGVDEPDDPLGDAFVLPYPSGRQAPRPDPAAGLAVVGRDGAAREADDPVTAVTAGLALQARWILDAQSALLGVGAGRIAVVGPAHAVAGPWWAAKRAVLPAPLVRVRAGEPVAAGAALLAAVRAGLADPALRLPADEHPPALRPDADEILAAFTSAALRRSAPNPGDA
jgi:xylulokinase